MTARGLPGLIAALVLVAAAPALAVPPQPIPEGPDAATLPVFSGRPATPHLLEPRTLATLAVLPLPPRVPGGGKLFTDFAGGGTGFEIERDGVCRNDSHKLRTPGRSRPPGRNPHSLTRRR